MTEMPIEVVRSEHRKRTIQAYVAGGRIRVLIPARLSAEEEAGVVQEMVAKVQKRLVSAEVDLVGRATQLAERYHLPKPTLIEWSDRQRSRWGTCVPFTGVVRISSRLATMPTWVLDWVIVHELAHLDVPDHGARFKALVGQYRLGERAEGYLIAKSEGQPPSTTG